MDQKELRIWLNDKENIAEHLPDFISIDDILATGGQGIVFRGKVGENKAAIKVYFPGQLSQRIDREISALKRIDCYSVVKILWHGKIDISESQLTVVATELIDGLSLDKLYTQQRLSDVQLGAIIYDISSAINAIWEHRIVHRDIKPSNILIRTDERACVIDLGVARHLDESTLTALGYTWGTSGYLSPEQARCSHQLTCKSDIFALGVVIVEILLGHHPSKGDQVELIKLNLHRSLPEPIKAWAYAGYVQAMLHPEPIKRPMPSDLLAAFDQFKMEEN